MTYTIRKIAKSEYEILEDFLFEAIFIPDGVSVPPREIIYQPELQVYVSEFGKKDGDFAFVAEVSGKIVGAVWVRIMNDYGHIDDDTPSFAISLYKEYRNNGIGTALMKTMLDELKNAGYKQASLAVQKENYAVKMYKNVGFITVDENDEEYIMLCKMWSILNYTPYRSKEHALLADFYSSGTEAEQAKHKNWIIVMRHGFENALEAVLLFHRKKKTQKIERDHLTLRRFKRPARKSICFSKDKTIHETVIISFINFRLFGKV